MPPGWRGDLRADSSDRGIDATFTLTSADGSISVLSVEAKRRVESRDVVALRERLLERLGETFDGGLVVSRFLSPPVRTRLAEAGLSYVDITGNVRMVLTRPGLFLSDRGADRDPWRGPGRPTGTLKGAPAAKVVRTLVDLAGPWTVRRLVQASGASTGSVYRVVEFLQGEELLERDPSGLLRVPDWVRLLRRWSDDYGFVRSNPVTRWIAPRGLSDLTRRLAAASHIRYVVTGTLAAARWAAYAPARSAMIYVAGPAEAAEAWGLRPAEAGANVMLAESQTDAVYARNEFSDGISFAAPAQVAVDLMTGPGRSPSEAEELIEWMVRNESSWRR